MMQRIGIGQQQRMHSRMVTHQRERRVLFQPPLLFPHRPSRSWRSPNCRTRVPTCPLRVRRSICQPSLSPQFPPASLPSLSVTRGHALTRLTPASPPLAVCLALRLSVHLSAMLASRSLTEVEDRPRLMFPTKLQPFPLSSLLRSLIGLTSLSPSPSFLPLSAWMHHHHRARSPSNHCCRGGSQQLTPEGEEEAVKTLPPPVSSLSSFDFFCRHNEGWINPKRPKKINIGLQRVSVPPAYPHCTSLFSKETSKEE